MSDAMLVLDELKSFVNDILKAKPRPNVGYQHSEHLLALKSAVKQVFPCPLYQFQSDGRRVVFLYLNQKRSDWDVIDSPALPEWMLDDLQREGSISGHYPKELCVYWILSSEHFKNDFICSHTIREQVNSLLERTLVRCISEEWSTKEQLIFNEIGLREWEINPWPSNPNPCPQIQAIVTLSPGNTFNPISFEDVVSRVINIKLLTCVPDGIYKVLNRAAKLCIWGFQDWEFFTMAQHYSAMAIETSLKTLFMSLVGHPLELKIFNVKSKELLLKEEFPPNVSFDEIKEMGFRIPSKLKQRVEIRIGDFKLPINNPALVKWAKDYDFVSKAETRDIQYLLDRRNVMSHPNGIFIEAMNDSIGLLYLSVYLINRMWARALYPSTMIWENSFTKTPRWAKP